MERARLLISPCRWKSWWRSPTAPTAAPHPSPSAACKSVGLCHRSPKGGPDSGLIFAGALQKGTGVSKKKEKEKERNVKKQQMKGSLGRKTGTGRSRYFLLCARLSASQEGSLVSLFPSLILSVFSCAQRAGDANLAAALASFKYSYGLFILRASRMSHLSNIFFFHLPNLAAGT